MRTKGRRYHRPGPPGLTRMVRKIAHYSGSEEEQESAGIYCSPAFFLDVRYPLWYKFASFAGPGRIPPWPGP